MVKIRNEGGIPLNKERIDNQHEGRDKYFVDVDRMISEGLAGGTVSPKYDRDQIGETHDFPKEDPPHQQKKS